MKSLIVSVAFIAATMLAGQKLMLRSNDVVGDWVSLQQCPNASLEKFSFDGDYFSHCFDMLDMGRWSLRDGDKIVITHYDDAEKKTISSKSRRETITIVGWERHSDRTFMYVRLADGRPDKWMK
jgi:hypothetical protein